MNRLLTRVGVVLPLMLLTSAVFAQDSVPPNEEDFHDEEAQMHFSLGSSLYQRGEFERAAEEFQAAYDNSGRAPLLYNIYIAHRDVGNATEAAVALRLYLERSEGNELREVRAVLERRLAVLEQQADEQVANVETEEPETPIHSDAQLSNQEAERTSEGSGIPAGAIVAGIGGAALIGGGVTGVMALLLDNDLADRCGENGLHCEPGARDDISRGKTFALTTDILLIGGGVLLTVGLIWQILAGSDGDEPPVQATCGGTGCTASFGGRF